MTNLKGSFDQGFDQQAAKNSLYVAAMDSAREKAEAEEARLTQIFKQQAIGLVEQITTLLSTLVEVGMFMENPELGYYRPSYRERHCPLYYMKGEDWCLLGEAAGTDYDYFDYSYRWVAHLGNVEALVFYLTFFEKEDVIVEGPWSLWSLLWGQSTKCVKPEGVDLHFEARIKLDEHYWKHPTVGANINHPDPVTLCANVTGIGDVRSLVEKIVFSFGRFSASRRS